MTRLPILLVAVILLFAGALRLLGEEDTSRAGAGMLAGAGLVVLGIWVFKELQDRD